MTRSISTRVLLLTALLLGALTSWAQADEKPNIIWECGQNVPNSAYWKKYGAELEAMLPFDGVMLSMEYPVTEEGRLGVAHDRRPTWKVLKRPEITEEMTKPFVDDMLAAELTKQHNMVNVWLGTGWPYLDFFDDALGGISGLHATLFLRAQLARVRSQGGGHRGEGDGSEGRRGVEPLRAFPRRHARGDQRRHDLRRRDGVRLQFHDGRGGGWRCTFR